MFGITAYNRFCLRRAWSMLGLWRDRYEIVVEGVRGGECRRAADM